MKKGLILFVLFTLIILSGLYIYLKYSNDNKITEDKNKNENKDDYGDLTVDQILDSMSINEKIGQMFMVTLGSLEKPAQSGIYPKKISDKQVSNLKKYNVGGVIYFLNNLSDKESLIEYNNKLQENTNYPLFIGVDEEGGLVSRLGKSGKFGVTYFPSMAEVGLTKDSKQAFIVGDTLGSELKMLGFNLDFAPVADIFTNPNNKVIGNRAFGNDKDLVSSMVKEEVLGLQGQNVSATLKHFPGHGDTNTDTHTGSATVDFDLNRLESTELVPFKSGIDAGADFVLTAHISLPNVTSDNTPSTMSKVIITDILRNKLNFKKIVITDALDMGAISNYYDTDYIVINCINAGVDILLMPKNFEEAYNTLVKAVQDGTISEERINESVRRIIQVKIDRGLFK